VPCGREISIDSCGRRQRLQTRYRSISTAAAVDRYLVCAVAPLPALGPWAPPSGTGPSLESIYRVSLTVDLCEGNNIISLFHHSQLGPLKKKKNPVALGTCPVCPLVKKALGLRALQSNDIWRPQGIQQQTSRTPLLLSIDGTDRRTDGHATVAFLAMRAAGSVNN